MEKEDYEDDGLGDAVYEATLVERVMPGTTRALLRLHGFAQEERDGAPLHEARHSVDAIRPRPPPTPAGWDAKLTPGVLVS